jgi:hypothetical protein
LLLLDEALSIGNGSCDNCNGDKVDDTGTNGTVSGADDNDDDDAEHDKLVTVVGEGAAEVIDLSSGWVWE